MASPPPFHLALFDPEIPPNTGNAARISAAFGVPLHLVGEPSFSLSEKALRRAGVDYWPQIDLRTHPTVWHLREALAKPRLVLFTTRATTSLSDFEFRAGDVLAFGNESRGLAPEIHRDFGSCSVRIDQPGAVRSLNLAVSVGIAAWAAWTQLSKA